MKNLALVIVSIIAIATSCSKAESSNEAEVVLSLSDTIVNIDLNILICPDLSNRITDIYPKPLEDVNIIKNVLDLYYPNIYKSGGRVLGQKDKISILITNPQLMKTYNINEDPLMIDIGDFNNEERIRYVTGSLNRRTFESDKVEMINEMAKVYDVAKHNTVGADIYDLFKSRLNNDIVLNKEPPIKSYGHVIINKERNILILLTDGYIEAGLYGEPASDNRYHYLDNAIVKDFRKKFANSGEANMKTFFENNGYGLVPIDNKALENLEVLVVEFYDRSLSRKSGNNTVLPDDFDIMKLFWEDWMKKSGVKKYRIYERFASMNDFETALKNFILYEK